MASSELIDPSQGEVLASHETQHNSELLFRDGKVRIQHPLEQAVPIEEGIQLVVDTGRELNRESSEDIPDLLRSAFYALALAKVLAEGRFTEEFWANIHMNSWPGTENSINVFGKNPQSKESWGKPVRLRAREGRSPEALDENEKKKLQRTMELYLPRWERKAQEITIFDHGINEIKPNEESFQQEAEIWKNRQEPAIWMNEKFVLAVVKNPHLDGLHLVCHARKDYWSEATQKAVIKAWETPKGEEEPTFLKGFVEANAILLAAEQIVREAGDFYNPEIHFSGNWGFRPLDPVSDETSPWQRGMDFSYLAAEDLKQARKMEKVGAQRRWAPDESEPDWHSHGHLYATRNPEEFVSLPSRPMKEVPEEWQKTRPLSPEEEEKIYQLIQEKLTAWLETNCQGVKIG